MGDRVAGRSVEAGLEVCICCWGPEGMGVLGRLDTERKEGEDSFLLLLPFIWLRPWQDRAYIFYSSSRCLGTWNPQVGSLGQRSGSDCGSLISGDGMAGIVGAPPASP